MRSIPLLALLCFILSCTHKDREEGPIVIERATVIGFFPPVTDSDLEKDGDLNEALADFREHFVNARSYFEKKNVRVVELYAKQFTCKLDGKNIEFHPKRDIGYLIAAPGRKPKALYGVMTDIDLGDAIDAYLNANITNEAK